MSDFKKMSVGKKLANAISGLGESFKQELSLRLQLLVGIIAIFCAFYFNFTRVEWLILLLVISIVIFSEILNTAIEELCDLYSLEHNLKIKKIKDISAGFVLVVSIFSLAIGIILFWPYL